MSALPGGVMLADTSAASTSMDLIKDGSDASFMADVVEAPHAQPVIVQFRAGWSRQCKQFGPALERAVIAAEGAVRLIRMDIEKNPRVASRFQVWEVPTVVAFVGGRRVDGFDGAMPESQLKGFIDRLIGPARRPMPARKRLPARAAKRGA